MQAAPTRDQVLDPLWLRAVLHDLGAPLQLLTCLPSDLRGVIRPQDGNGDGLARCDMGAVEGERLPSG